MNSTAYDKLRSQVEYPEAWKPHAGSPATLVGEVLAWTEIPFRTKDGEERRQLAIVVRDEDGKEWSVATFHTVLRNELLENEKLGGRVEPRDFVAIHYVGEKPRQSGDGTVHSYRVAVDRPEPKAEDGSGDIPF